ncbi:MAG: SRPBCC family protein [Nocardioidaceae bacterium]|nr:SRPBCC family protein [Nocardioidaceae bacterium]NUS52531.1 SRPBCC family protein [Nocardioidaceae bacterium]
MSESLHLSTYVARPAHEVYAYVGEPAHLPEWAAGLSGSIEERDGRWFADSPMGEVEVRFASANPHGVLDHDVTLPDGTVVTNPMRVIPDGEGSEVVFTLRRRPGMTDAELDADAAAVRSDLATLKALLER